MLLLKLVLSGYFLLFFAIVINAGVKYFNIMTWYDLLNSLKGKTALKKLKIIDVIWLFIGYPISLGIVIYGATEIFFHNLLHDLTDVL